jgi:hypothetical protein
MPSCLGSYRERQQSSHLLSDLSKRGPRGTGCGHDQTRESLNEAQIHVSHRSALSDQFLVRVIPKDDLSLNVLDGRSGHSFLLLMICLSKVCQKMVCQFLVRVIPKDGQSSNVLDALHGRSCGFLCQMSFCLSKVCQKMVCRYVAHEIPMDGLSVMLAYARLLNLNCGRYKKVCLTSSFFPDGRKLILRCAAYQSTRALVRGHPIGEHRRSFWCRALRGHLLCDEACDQLRF